MDNLSEPRHFVRESVIPLPSVAIPEGSDLYQYDTDLILFYNSRRAAWYDQDNDAWYKPGTVMEPMQGV